MALNPQAGRLTESHRLAQARLGADTVRQLIATWPLLDMTDLDATIERWLRVAVPVVQAQRTRSARLAANYLATFRALELGVATRAFVPVLVEDVDRSAVITSLTVTGPASVKAATRRGIIITKAAEVAKAAAAGAAMRHALNGGRETIVATVKADPRAAGYARVTSGKACDFCTMLAGRGAVYGEQSADFEAHDHCSCSAEPVYTGTA